MAIDDLFVDGGDALVFPPLEGRVDQIRGPVIIEGGEQVGVEQFLNNPVLLPGETNFPVPEGRLSTVGGDTTTTPASITDTAAIHVSGKSGDVPSIRPGFDPRMNDFAYTTTFLSSTGSFSLDVASVSADILSLKLNGTAVTSSSVAEFIGTPLQSALPSIHWTQVTVTLSGSGKIGERWTLRLDGVDYFFDVTAGNELPAKIAQGLRDAVLAANAGYSVELRISILGDAKLVVRKGGTLFTAGFAVPSGSDGGATIGGIASLADISKPGVTWTDAAVHYLTPGAEHDIWSLQLGGTDAAPRARR